MLAGNGTAQFGTARHDFLRGLHHSFGLITVTSIKHEKWLQVSIPGVKNISNLQFVFPSYLLDVLKHFWKLGASDHSVLHIIVWTDPPERPKRIFAAFPEKGALLGGLGAADASYLIGGAHRLDLLRLFLHSLAQTLDFDQQNGGRIQRIPGVRRLLHGAQRKTVHHF